MNGHVTSTDRYTLISDVMVPMRDGVRLATDIYLPAASGAASAHASARLPALMASSNPRLLQRNHATN